MEKEMCSLRVLGMNLIMGTQLPQLQQLFLPSVTQVNFFYLARNTLNWVDWMKNWLKMNPFQRTENSTSVNIGFGFFFKQRFIMYNRATLSWFGYGRFTRMCFLHLFMKQYKFSSLRKNTKKIPVRPFLSLPEIIFFYGVQLFTTFNLGFCQQRGKSFLHWQTQHVPFLPSVFAISRKKKISFVLHDSSKRKPLSS